MSATNDPYVDRYALPGVPAPLLGADIVNKSYIDQRFLSTRGIIAQTVTAVTNSTTPVDTPLKISLPPIHSMYKIEVYGSMHGGTSTADMKCGFSCTSSSFFIDFQFTSKNSQPNSIRILSTSPATGTTPLQTGNNQSRVHIEGILVMDGGEPSDRDVTFQFAQNVAEPTTLELGVESYMILTNLPLPVNFSVKDILSTYQTKKMH